jgi:hypothetical protein
MIAIELIEVLLYKLRMFGIPVENPTEVYIAIISQLLPMQLCLHLS